MAKIPKVATFYNNKGGVSKTTTLFNVAVFLSQRKSKKILLVDCDPQCNLTELFLASSETYLKELKLPGTSVYQALRPRFQGDASRVDAGTVELISSPIYERLSLLRGDFELSLAEAYLSSAVNLSITENVHEKNTYLALRRLFVDVGKLHDVDYVLVDVGPSTGALTRLAFLSCDVFVIPTTPDRFCNQAVEVLSRVVADWVRRHKDIMSTFPPFGLETFVGRPVFLGAVSQNFKAFSGRLKESYAKWDKLIAKNLRRHFVENGPVGHSSQVEKSPYLTQIPDVGTLAPIAQMFGRAIFDVQRSDTEMASTTGASYGGVVWANWVERMHDYEKRVGAIAAAIQNG